MHSKQINAGEKKQHTKHLGNRLPNSLSFVGEESNLGELDHVSRLSGFSVLAFALQGIPENRVIHTQAELLPIAPIWKVYSNFEGWCIKWSTCGRCQTQGVRSYLYVLWQWWCPQCLCIYFSLTDPFPFGPCLKYFLANSSISYLVSCSTLSSSSPSLKPSKGTL